MRIEQETVRAGLRRAGARAVHTGQVAGSALIAVLCAGALAPLVAVPLGVGDLGAAVAGLVGSIGGNVATDFLTSVAARLRGEDQPLELEAVEHVLADAVEQALAEGGAVGAAMRELAAGILQEAEAMRAVMSGALAENLQAAEGLVTGLAGLTQHFAEFSSATDQIRAVALSLQQAQAISAVERLERDERDLQLALLMVQLREALDAIRTRETRRSEDGPVWNRCPYPGLAPFRQGEAQVFFGRREMTRRLIQKVVERAQSGGLLVMLGASGAGKSSLLHAGLLPALARDALGRTSGTWPVRVITPGDDPLARLAAQLAALTARSVLEVVGMLQVNPRLAASLAVDALAAHVWEAGGARPVLVLVVDQFEELFRLPVEREQERALFLEAIHALAAPAPHVVGGVNQPAAVVIAAVRGDFLDQAAAYRVMAEALAAGPFVVDPMTPTQLREAIEGPAVEAGAQVEPKLVEAILREVFGTSGAGGTGTQVLSLVSQALAEIWRIRRGSSLTLRAYYSVGGMVDAANRSAQDVYERLNARGQTAARAMFMQLTQVTVDGRVARRAVAREELRTAAGLTAAEQDAVIEAFTQRRLLVAEMGDIIAICHDVLLDAWHQLHNWLEGDTVDRALYSEVLADAQAWKAGWRDLYGRRRLSAIDEAAARWADDPGRYPALSESAQRFLTASRRATKRATRLRLTAVIGLVALAGTAIGLAVVANGNAQQIDAQHLIALSRQLAADSATVRDRNPVLARRLAVAAWAAAPTPEAEDAMTTPLADDWRQGVITTSSGGFNSVAFSPNGKTLAAAGEDGTVRLWDSATEQPRATLQDVTPLRFPERSTGALSAVFSADGKTLAVSGYDGTVKLWDPVTGYLRTTIRPGAGDASLLFSPDGRTLAVGGVNGTVGLWDAATGILRNTIRLASPAEFMAFSPDGKTLAASVYNGLVQLIDVPTRQPGATLHATTSDVRSIVFSPDGHTLAAAQGDGSVQMWNLATGEPHGTLHAATDQGYAAATDRVYSVAFSPDGKILAVGINSYGGTVQLWDPATWHLRTVLHDSENAVYSVAFSPDGNALAAGGSANGTVQMWNLTAGQPHLAYSKGTAFSKGAIDPVAFSPDGVTLAAGTSDGPVRQWTASGQARTTLLLTDITDTKYAYQEFSVAFSPDGKTLAAGGSGGTVRLWDPATGKLHARLQGDTTGGVYSVVYSVTFSPDGKTLAAGGRDGTVRLWDPATGKLHASLHDTTGEVLSLAFSPDGKTLAAGGSDGTAKLWDPATGKLRATLHTADEVHSLAFSPDGKTLASAGGLDGTVELWTLAFFENPYRVLCANTGALSLADWAVYAPDEQEPPICT